jgi:hypothetical protein
MDQYVDGCIQSRFTFSLCKQILDAGPDCLPIHRNTNGHHSSLRRRSLSVGSNTQEDVQMSDVATAALQSDEDISVIVSLLDHVIKERKDLGCGFRRLLVYFIIYFWFLELKGTPLSQSKEPIYDIGTNAHCASLTSTDILEYLDQYVHPLQGFTAHLQNGNFFTPGRTVIRRLKTHWESMATRRQDLEDDDTSRWRALSYVFGNSLPPIRSSDEAKSLGPLAYKIIYSVDWQNLMKSLSSSGLVLPMN